MAKAMPFCHAGAADSDRPVSDCLDASTGKYRLLNQIHGRVGQIDVGVERLVHSHAAQATQG